MLYTENTCVNNASSHTGSTPYIRKMCEHKPIPSHEQHNYLTSPNKHDREAVLLGYSRYMWRKIQMYRPDASYHEKDELFQELFLGLMDAARTFDPSKGMFSTWVTQWVRDTIKRHRLSRQTIRIPYDTLQLMHEYRKAEELLTSASADKVEFDTICDFLDITDKTRLELIASMEAKTEPVPPDFDAMNTEPPPDFHLEVQEEVNKAYGRLNSLLSEEEQNILLLKIDGEFTREEIAQLNNITLKELTDKERIIREILKAA